VDSLVEQIMIEIIKAEMNLDNEQVWIRSQNRKIPPDTKMFITVGVVDVPRVMSSVRYTREDEIDPLKLWQCQQIVMRENIQIDIFSRDNASIRRNWEVIAALTSYRSEQAQELNNFKIFQTPSAYVNTSAVEGGSTLNRYTIIVPTHAWYYKENPLPNYDYYDEFSNRVDDANTIGTANPLIQFVIDENTEITIN